MVKGESREEVQEVPTTLPVLRGAQSRESKTSGSGAPLASQQEGHPSSSTRTLQ